ncbi:MAG: TIGR02206 family membrane protein [Verrucomicrobiales bacterium VVV1]|nr:MAG: TIGR02206 family membrane protein [Verrucomicrobiales bacterium VVV1]
MPPPFHPFSREHGIAILIGAVAIFAMIFAGKRSEQGRLLSTGLLAFLNLMAYPMCQLAWFEVPNAGLENIVPFHLCDLAAILAGFALLTRRQVLCELTFYWGLAGTIQGLLTPAIQVGYPAWPFVTFFVMHFSIVAAALYLPIVDGWRPERPWWRSPWRAFLWVNAYILCAMALNAMLGTNFGFAAHKPVNPSLLDHLGPWPWYLLSLELLALVLCGLLTLPFLRKPRGGK